MTKRRGPASLAREALAAAGPIGVSDVRVVPVHALASHGLWDIIELLTASATQLSDSGARTSTPIDVAAAARTFAAGLDAGSRVKFLAKLQDGLFAKWVMEDPAGASAHIAQVLRETHERAARETPDGVQHSTRVEALHEAAEGADRLVGILAAATSKSVADVKAAVNKWQASGSHSVETAMPESNSERGGGHGPGQESLHEGDWPFAHLSVLANALYAARNGEPAISGVDQSVADQAWSALVLVNEHLVAAVAEAIDKAPPQRQIRVLDRLRHRPTFAGVFSTATFARHIEQRLSVPGPGGQEGSSSASSRNVPFGSPLLPGTPWARNSVVNKGTSVKA